MIDVLCLGKLMNDSGQALEDMAARNGGIVTCPQTGKSVPFTELKKVFIS